jgi:uncharacterized protein YggE
MRTVTVTGHGSSQAVPDAAVVRVAAVQRGEGVAEAYAALTATAVLLVEVAARHTHPRFVASTGISVWPWHDHQGRPAGFEARHSYAVRCIDLDVAGGLLADLVAQVGDALVVDSIGLEVTDDSLAAREAREAAFADARERARELARLAGLRVGPLQSVVEGPSASAGGGTRFARAASDGGLAPGEAAVRMTIEAVWELVEE